MTHSHDQPPKSKPLRRSTARAKTSPSGSIPQRPKRDLPRAAKKTPTLTVLKIDAAIVERGRSRVDVERACELAAYRIYNWLDRGLSPDSGQILRISQELDLSIEYLLDDRIPVAATAPRRSDEVGRVGVSSGVLDGARLVRLTGLSAEEIERGLILIQATKALGLDPAESLRRICEGGSSLLIEPITAIVGPGATIGEQLGITAATGKDGAPPPRPPRKRK